MNKDDLFCFFHGHWSLERSVYIKSTGSLHAQAYGSASFVSTETKQLLHYEEQGKIVMETNVSALRFSRKFQYIFQQDLVNVFFADGPNNGSLYQKYIYKPKEQKLIPEQIHICGNDLYEGEYQLLNAESFMLITVINGTSKDFLIKTKYARDLK